MIQTIQGEAKITEPFMVKIDMTQLTDWDMLLASILVSEIYGNVVESDWMTSVFTVEHKKGKWQKMTSSKNFIWQPFFIT